MNLQRILNLFNPFHFEVDFKEGDKITRKYHGDKWQELDTVYEILEVGENSYKTRYDRNGLYRLEGYILFRDQWIYKKVD